jgi:hypothetical protein
VYTTRYRSAERENKKRRTHVHREVPLDNIAVARATKDSDLEIRRACGGMAAASHEEGRVVSARGQRAGATPNVRGDIARRRQARSFDFAGVHGVDIHAAWEEDADRAEKVVLHPTPYVWIVQDKRNANSLEICGWPDAAEEQELR